VRLEQSFEVDAPLERVWEALIDVARVAPCLPGAEVTEVDADGVYRGTFTVKLGPTTASYRGELKIDSLDDAAHKATMRASGTDKRGQGGAKATMVSTLTERDGGGTEVAVETDFTITGRLARFGRGGMIQDVSNRLLRDFAECLRSGLERPAEAGGASVEAPAAPLPAKPVGGLRLLLGALWDRLRRLFRRSS
jgi:carbon monoxide dehydrogenase subunit G